jgi:DNA-binding transcriptional regulator YiaG
MKKNGNRLHEQVQSLRSRLGMNQSEFAAKFGVSAMAVSRWESGANEPPGHCLVEMAKLAGNPNGFWYFLGVLGLTKRDMKGR